MDDILYDYVQDEEVLNQVKATGIEDRVEALEATGTTVNPGYRVDFSNSQIDFNPVQPIVKVTGNSVTFAPDTAYQIIATTGAVNVTANPPAADYWGYEGHAEIFVGSVGYVVFDTSKIVLANALEPDSVNNCTLRFHDGMCYVSVEDHIAGYIVVNGSTSGDGSLPYGIDTSANEYIAFDASLNGTTIDLSGSTANGEKHVVGNGYTETTLTGAVDCGTSKFTVANLSLQNVGITGGTMTFGDAYIPSGSTVAVNGGKVMVEKVTGNGGTIDLGGSAGFSAGVISASGVRFINGSANRGGAFRASGGVISDCVFRDCVADVYGGALMLDKGVEIDSCVFSGCSCVTGGAVYVSNVPTEPTHINGCTFSANGGGLGAIANIGKLYISNSVVSGNSAPDMRQTGQGGVTYFVGGNTVGLFRMANGSAFLESGTHVFDRISDDQYGSGTLVISSGAIVDLTGNTNTTPIAPGGGITFEPGGATVKVGDATASSSYMIGDAVLSSGATLTNTRVINLGAGKARITSASGCIISGGSAGSYGAVVANTSSSGTFDNVTFVGNSGAFEAKAVVCSGTSANLSLLGCTVSGFTANAGKGIANYATMYMSGCVAKDNGTGESACDVYVASGGNTTIEGSEFGRAVLLTGGTLSLTGVNSIGRIDPYSVNDSGSLIISAGASITLTSSISPGGITVLEGGCIVNGNAIAAGTYTSIDSTGTPT